MEALREWGTESIAFLLEAEKRKLSKLDQIAVWTKLCTNRQLEDVYGQELRCRLAVWLSEQEKNKELNAFLRTLSKEQIAEKDRLCMARLMLLHGFYDKAYEWLAGQCFCKLEPAELMRLCSRLLAKESHLEEKRLMLLCAQAALKEDIVVENQPDEDRARQSERDYEEQKRAFLKRAVMQQLGRKAGKGGLRILSETQMEEKAAAAMAQLKENTWEKRIST